MKPVSLGLVTFSVMMPTLMQALDMTIANVALPHIQGALSAAPDQISWVLTSYIVASAIATAPTSFIASRFGRKQVFIVAVIGFTLASMLCGLAATLPQMVTFRLLQGVFGAAFAPLSQMILLDTYPKEKHGTAMALWGAGVMVGPIIGPTLGGWLTDEYSWRWVFYINAPIGILSILGLSAALPATPPQRAERLDVLGFALLSVAVGALQLMLDRGQTQGWFGSSEIRTEAALALLCFYLFVAHSFTAESPFLPLRLFRDSNFFAGMVMMFLVTLVLFSSTVLLPSFLQVLQGYPVIDAGLIMTPRGVGNLLAMVALGQVIGRVDPRWVIFAGLGLTGITFWIMTGFTLDVSTAEMMWINFLQGIALGWVFVPISTLTYTSLSPELRGDAAAIFNLGRNIGSSIGVALSFALLDRGTQQARAQLVESVNLYNPALHQYISADGGLGALPGLAMLNGEIDRQATLLAMLGDFRLMMFAVLLTLPLLLLFRPRAGAASEAPRVVD